MLEYELRVSITMIGIKDEMQVKAHAMLHGICDIAVKNKVNLSQSFSNREFCVCKVF